MVTGVDGQGLDGTFRALHQRQADADGQHYQEADDLSRADAAGRLLFNVAAQVHPQDGQTAQDQAHKGQAGGQHEVVQQVFQQEAEAHHADEHAHAQGDEQFHTLLEVLEQTGNGTDQLIVDAHGHRHGATGYAGNDVGDTDHDTAQDIQYSVHSMFLSLGSHFRGKPCVSQKRTQAHNF